jgi:hypothetical protein
MRVSRTVLLLICETMNRHACKLLIPRPFRTVIHRTDASIDNTHSDPDSMQKQGL